MVRRLRASAWGSNCNNLGGKVNSCKGCWIGSSLVAFMGFIVLNPFLCFVLMGAKFAGKKSDVNLKLIIFKTFLWLSRFHRKWRKLAFKICQKKKTRGYLFIYFMFFQINRLNNRNDLVWTRQMFQRLSLSISVTLTWIISSFYFKVCLALL